MKYCSLCSEYYYQYSIMLVVRQYEVMCCVCSNRILQNVSGVYGVIRYGVMLVVYGVTEYCIMLVICMERCMQHGME